MESRRRPRADRSIPDRVSPLRLAAVAYLYIMAGALVGAPLRYFIGGHTQRWIASGFPWGTLVVNVTGCFLIGVVAILAERHDWLSREARLLLITGFLGSYTTFSAFSFETYGLMRGDEPVRAGAYILCSVVIGLAATWLGAALARLA